MASAFNVLALAASWRIDIVNQTELQATEIKDPEW